MNENNKISVINNISNLGTGKSKDAFWHSRAGSLYTSVKNKVLSYFEGNNVDQQVGAPQKKSVQGSSSIRKFVANTSFVVGGLVGGLVVAPVAHADPQKASTAPTAIAPKVAKPNVSTASEKKAVAEANQIRIDTKLKKLLVLKNMKGELAHEGVPLSVKDHGAYIITQQNAEASIDKKIKELTAKSASKPVSKASPHASKKHPLKIRHQKQEPKNSGIVVLQNTQLEPLMSTTGDLSLLLAPDLRYSNSTLGGSVFSGSTLWQPVPNSILDQTIGNTAPPSSATVGVLTPSLGPRDVPLGSGVSLDRTIALDPTTHLPVVSPKAAPVVVEVNPNDPKLINVPTLPPSASVVATSSRVSADLPNAVSGVVDNTVTIPPSATPTTSVLPPKKISTVKNAKTKTAKPKYNVVKVNAPKKVPVAPVLGSTTESGLNQDTLTDKKLEEFLSRVNIILGSADKKSGLKGVSFTYKAVTVKRKIKKGKGVKLKAVPALRIFLKQGDHTAYITMPLKYESCEYEYLSPNYRYISSESKLIDWAERKTKKWSQRQKKK